MSELTYENGYLYNGNQAYANPNTNNSLIKKMVSKFWDEVYGFEYLSQSTKFDPSLRKTLKGTVWVRVPVMDKEQGKNFSIVKDSKYSISAELESHQL